MKILFLTHFYKPEIGAASIWAQYFVKALRGDDYNVKVFTHMPNYPFSKIMGVKLREHYGEISSLLSE